MADSNKASVNGSKGKKRKYLPHGKPVRKGLYPLRPGVQGFFLTCDGGRERQAANEALNLLETFYEELVHGKESDVKSSDVPSKPLNTKIKFSDSDSSSDEEDDAHAEEPTACPQDQEDLQTRKDKEDTPAVPHDGEELEIPEHANEREEIPSKKQRVDADARKQEDKPIDELIEEELKELGDRKKRHFVSLDSGCNGVIFIQMHKRPGEPGPSKIVQYMMTRIASTRKHMSRFILRFLPVELACYASESEISKAIKPLVAEYFPSEAPTPQKFAVLYDARANTSVERMTVINAVAKSVPQPHKVDLKNPDKSIIVQIAKTICLIGVVERYKELSKFNLRELTSPKQ
ncbi:THUMP domain-containing protein 1 homolog [Zingiber officinale]|uniref:THUMP domain-containing protein 1 homolog n=1 Tax=Zingiber officinale TaxID=94328 RepID=UPI001C4C708D|nr:THUMP domain-containing protein 1 homolog [Zingiber officinale]